MDAESPAPETAQVADEVIAERQARIEAIARTVHAHLEHQLPASDHTWLYDDDGLPA